MIFSDQFIALEFPHFIRVFLYPLKSVTRNKRKRLPRVTVCQTQFPDPVYRAVSVQNSINGTITASSVKFTSRDGAAVRALASHQCDPGSIPGLGVICGLSLLLVLVPAPRVFLRVLRFSSLRKNQHF